MHFRFIYRQITTSWKQTTVFVACVALSLVTLVSLGGFGESVNNSLLRDARQLLAADVVVEAGFPFQDELAAELDELATQEDVVVANTYEFISVVRVTDGEDTLLSELKVVEPGYPFYGEVVLESGRPFGEVLQAGQIIVGQNLLDRLGLEIGDSLQVGDAELTIADVVIFEPDQPVDFFVLGPRIFTAAADLEALNLIKPGSRVSYRTLLQVPEGQVETVAAQLEAAADTRQESVDTYLTNQSGVQAFFEDFLSFLNLIGIFTLMLAGIGIQSSLSAFLKEREDTIAVLRTFGASGGFVIRQFFSVTVILGMVGIVIGLILGYIMQFLFPVVFAPFLPPQVEFILSIRAMLEGVLLGFFVVAAFTFLPLYQIYNLKPRFIFRRESVPLARGWLYFTAIGLILLFFAGMVYWYLRNPERTIYFAGGTVGLVLITAAITQGVLWVLRRRKLKPLASRQALRGLFRPRNATAAIIITLATSLAVLFTIYLIEANLDASFVEAYPEDAPNMFILDIQPDQREGVAEILSRPTTFFPVVRGRVVAVNGEAVTEDETNNQAAGANDPQQQDEDGPNLDFPFSLTYRTGGELESFEQLMAGNAVFSDQEIGRAQVSVSSELLEAYPFEVGDVIEFSIQGVPLEAEVTSLREIDQEEASFAPRFSFVFREADLVSAPQTILTTVNVAPEEVAGLQNRLVGAFPNLTVVDVSAAIDTLAELVGNITIIIRFFTLFSIVAGVLIIISSVLATRFARIQESVYFKVLGAKRQFVLKVFTLENVFIGFASALIALFLSQLAGYLLVTQVFELDYRPYWVPSVLLMAFSVGLVTTVGLLASISILNKKPITFLRDNTVE